MLELYLGEKIKFSDLLWREGLNEWKTLYDLYAEFLITPEQIRAQDRDMQMTTKTSYRLKYLKNKSEAWIHQKQEMLKSLQKQREKVHKEFKTDVNNLNERLKAESPDEHGEIEKDLYVRRGMNHIEKIHLQTQRSFARMDIQQEKETTKDLEDMRIAFWETTFNEPPVRLKKRIRELLKESYERRVDSILRGGVPWSSLYFWANSFYWMPSSRALYESHGKNYECPSTSVIVNRLDVLDETNPKWDENTPEIFFDRFVPKNQLKDSQKNKKGSSTKT